MLPSMRALAGLRVDLRACRSRSRAAPAGRTASPLSISMSSGALAGASLGLELRAGSRTGSVRCRRGSGNERDRRGKTGQRGTCTDHGANMVNSALVDQPNAA